MSLLAAAVGLLGLLSLLQTVVILALARQVGRIQVRLGPVGARMTSSGPEIGSAPPIYNVTDHRGRALRIGGPQAHNTLIMFISPKCNICKRLIPGLKALAQQEDRLEIVLVSDGAPRDHQNFLTEVDLGPLPYVVSSQMGMVYQIGVTPYGVLLDTQGRLRAKGLCNHMEHVESLVQALETGYPSIQDRLAATGSLNGSHGQRGVAPARTRS